MRRSASSPSSLITLNWGSECHTETELQRENPDSLKTKLITGICICSQPNDRQVFRCRNGRVQTHAETCSVPSVCTAGPCMLVRPHQNALQAHVCLFGPNRTYCRPMHACSGQSERTAGLVGPCVLVQPHPKALQVHVSLFGPIRTYCRPIHACSAQSERTAGPCRPMHACSAQPEQAAATCWESYSAASVRSVATCEGMFCPIESLGPFKIYRFHVQDL